LSFRWQLTDLVEENGAFFRKLEPTQPPLRCPREGASLMDQTTPMQSEKQELQTIHTDKSTGDRRDLL